MFQVTFSSADDETDGNAEIPWNCKTYLGFRNKNIFGNVGLISKFLITSCLKFRVSDI
jgi:hypothetical protein